MNHQTVTVELHDHVAELRLDRPEVLNAFDDALVNELPGVLIDLARDTDVRAVAWTSSGRHFSAGGDMETILAGHDDLTVLLRGVDDGRRLFRAFADFPKPLVTAVQGSSFGVATSLVFTSDAVVVTPTTKLADPHVHMGLVAGDGGAVTWPLSAGLARAKRKLLWGEPLTGREAFELGLATDLVESDDGLRDRALELAAHVAGAAADRDPADQAGTQPGAVAGHRPGARHRLLSRGAFQPQQRRGRGRDCVQGEASGELVGELTRRAGAGDRLSAPDRRPVIGRL